MLWPDYYYESVFDIDYQALWDRGIRGLIFDIDNTLTAYDARGPSDETAALLSELAETGFGLCLLTNNTNRRLRDFNAELGLPGFANAMKPFPWATRKAVRALGVGREQAAIVGDQLFTDVWGGRNCGLLTVLVAPITQKDFAFVKFKRMLERRVLRGFFEGMGKTE